MYIIVNKRNCLVRVKQVKVFCRRFMVSDLLASVRKFIFIVRYFFDHQIGRWVYWRVQEKKLCGVIKLNEIQMKSKRVGLINFSTQFYIILTIKNYNYGVVPVRITVWQKKTKITKKKNLMLTYVHLVSLNGLTKFRGPN